MPNLGKPMLLFAGAVVLIIVGFSVHWLIGVGLIAVLLVYAVYANRPAYYALKANAAYAQGDLDRALKLQEKAYAMRRRHPQQAINYAYMLMKAGKPEQAERVLQELLRTRLPHDMEMQAKSNLATALWLMGRREEAVRLLEDVHRAYKTVMVVGNLGYLKLLKEGPEKALAFNEEAYAYDDNDPTILDNLAQNYYLLGRLEEAAAMYAKVVERAPKHAEPYYYYALTLEALGRAEEAEAQALLALAKPLALVTTVAREEIEALVSRLSAREAAASEDAQQD
jgi:tetratricopeptide (TPR) repeat protein